MFSAKKPVPLNRTFLLVCLAIILLAVLAGNFWRLQRPDPDAVRAVSIYSGILEEIRVVGAEFTFELTTTLGFYPAKKVSEDPLTAAIMVRLFKDAGIDKNSVVAINASGSFPGFTLASLSALSAMGIETYVIASIGSSTFGANIPGNTIADMLLNDAVRNLGHTLLAVTPGGGNDRGSSLDPDELERISEMLHSQRIPYIQPVDFLEAIELRDYLFSSAGSTILINIGGNHASTGPNYELDFMAGILRPGEVEDYDDPGLIQFFLKRGLPVIQILNVRLLYAGYGLEFDDAGRLLGNNDRLLRPNNRQR